MQAAVRADVGPVADAERARRQLLRFPPETAMAEVSGPAAPAFIEQLGAPAGVEVVEAGAGRWWLRAPDHQVLCDALAAPPVGRRGRLRDRGRPAPPSWRELPPHLPAAGSQSSKRLPSGSSAQVKRP